MPEWAIGELRRRVPPASRSRCATSSRSIARAARPAHAAVRPSARSHPAASSPVGAGPASASRSAPALRLRAGAPGLPGGSRGRLRRQSGSGGRHRPGRDEDRWPTTTSLAMSFTARRSRGLIPNLLAMDLMVSPCFTVYLRAISGVGVGLGGGLERGPGVAGDGVPTASVASGAFAAVVSRCRDRDHELRCGRRRGRRRRRRLACDGSVGDPPGLLDGARTAAPGRRPPPRMTASAATPTSTTPPPTRSAGDPAAGRAGHATVSLPKGRASTATGMVSRTARTAPTAAD